MIQRGTTLYSCRRDFLQVEDCSFDAGDCDNVPDADRKSGVECRLSRLIVDSSFCFGAVVGEWGLRRRWCIWKPMGKRSIGTILRSCMPRFVGRRQVGAVAGVRWQAALTILLVLVRYCDRACQNEECGFDAGDCGIEEVFDGLSGIDVRETNEVHNSWLWLCLVSV